jgi:hypothetical protein
VPGGWRDDQEPRCHRGRRARAFRPSPWGPVIAERPPRTETFARSGCAKGRPEDAPHTAGVSAGRTVGGASRGIAIAGAPRGPEVPRIRAAGRITHSGTGSHHGLGHVSDVARERGGDLGRYAPSPRFGKGETLGLDDARQSLRALADIGASPWSRGVRPGRAWRWDLGEAVAPAGNARRRSSPGPPLFRSPGRGRALQRRTECRAPPASSKRTGRWASGVPRSPEL